jgi:hypothetical protein
MKLLKKMLPFNKSFKLKPKPNTRPLPKTSHYNEPDDYNTKGGSEVIRVKELNYLQVNMVGWSPSLVRNVFVVQTN